MKNYKNRDLKMHKNEGMQKCKNEGIEKHKNRDMKKHKSVWFIIAQTNLHVGDENLENIGIIDKTIQRDATTKIPCIHSSSLKGAIKEFIAHWNKKKEEENKKDETISCLEVFGSDYRNDKNTQKGNSIFFDANLLALPVQCTNQNYPFQLVYQSQELELFNKRLEVLGLRCTVDQITERIRQEIPEEIELKELSNLDDPDLHGLSFSGLCSDENLPIIARNKLDTGEDDGNLWYEQVLPAWSVLGTLICTDNDKLEEVLNEAIIQIGAHATVGYGYCKFIKLM